MKMKMKMKMKVKEKKQNNMAAQPPTASTPAVPLTRAEQILADNIAYTAYLKKCMEAVAGRDKKREFQAVIARLEEQYKQLRSPVSIATMASTDLSRARATAMGTGTTQPAALNQLAFVNQVNPVALQASVTRASEDQQINDRVSANLPRLQDQLTSLKSKDVDEYTRINKTDEDKLKFVKQQLSSYGLPTMYLDAVSSKLMKVLKWKDG
jgi:hypothetical protein